MTIATSGAAFKLLPSRVLHDSMLPRSKMIEHKAAHRCKREHRIFLELGPGRLTSTVIGSENGAQVLLLERV